MPLTMDVKVGEAVQIGNEVIVRVERKSGNRIKLKFETTLAPIRLVGEGLGLANIVTGLSGRQEKA